MEDYSSVLRKVYTNMQISGFWGMTCMRQQYFPGHFSYTLGKRLGNAGLDNAGLGNAGVGNAGLSNAGLGMLGWAMLG